MIRTRVTLIAMGAILAIGSGTAVADSHRAAFKVIPVDLYACNYKDQKGPDDLDAYAAKFNEWADDKNLNDMSIWTLTPYYFGPGDNSDFDFIWMIAGKTAVAMGKTHDTWIADNDGLMEVANSIASCRSHANYASVNYKPAPDDETPKDAVLTFSDCNYDKDATFEALEEAMHTWSDHLTEKGSTASIFHWYPVYGGGGEQFDFKWLEAHENYEALGVDFESYGNGRGFETYGELLGPLVTCDAARVYQAKNRRSVQLR